MLMIKSQKLWPMKGIKLEVLNPLESLTKEQMDNGEDYVSVMEDNLKALEKTTMVLW